MQLQVDKNHYFKKNYITNGSWMNYYYQINNTLSLNPKKVLVIGVGDGITPKYLKGYGIKTITLDFDPKLKPDIVADISNLPKKLKKEKFDVIICAHVLEHLPFKYFDKILKDFSKITSYLVLQLPSSILQIKFNFAIQPHVLNKNFIINIPILFWKKLSFNGQHYWKLHRRNESMIKVKKVIKKYFTIKKLYQCPENCSSYNFILQSNFKK
jgi:ubiquinone/menaquinone biosynthesis C-methylase UbiE